MMGPTHRLFGALSGAAYASYAGYDRPTIALAAVVASASSNGWTSPDLDQTKPWVTLGRASRLVALRGLFQHRYGLTHWWALPVLAWLFGVDLFPSESRWAAQAIIIGWASHLVGDLIFGRLALLPWGGPKIGVGLSTNGFVESGHVQLFGERRKVSPVAPIRVVLSGALVAVFWYTPTAAALPHVPVPARQTLTASSAPPYERAAFGSAWADVDRNGCDTRNDMLNRDLTDRTHRDTRGCVVLTGVLERDLYASKRIEFSKAYPTKVQIDHVVSLSDAWTSGAWAWTADRRKTFANDPFNLVAVDGSTNQSKSDQGPDTWSPADKASACRYVTRYVLVKAKYGLPLTAAQAEAISVTFTACNERTAP